MLLYEDLTRTIIGAAMEVHRALGPGFIESVYEMALGKELTDMKIPVEHQAPVPVVYKGVELGKYFADILVDGKIILEIKAASALIPRHDAQAIHYLAATKLRLALLLNFGTPKLQFKRIIR